MNLDILNGNLEIKPEPGIDTLDPRFTNITALVHKADYQAAAESSKSLLEEGHYDIRLICYVIFGIFLDEGLGSIGGILACLDNLIRDNLQALGPGKNRKKQVSTSLVWLLGQILKCLEKDEKKETTWNAWLETFTLEEVEQWFNSGTDLEDSLTSALGKSGEPPVNKLKKLNGWIKDIMNLVGPESECVEEGTSDKTAEEELSSDQESVDGAGELQKTDLDKKTDVNPMVEGSYLLTLLIRKLEIFEILIESNSLEKAAIVAGDIQSTLENFDPKSYLPKLFSTYTRLLARNIGMFAAFEEKMETPEWKAMEDFYHVDPEAFVKFER